MEPDLQKQRRLKLSSYSEIKAKIISAVQGLTTEIESIPVIQANGRICAEDIASTRDMPSDNLAAMDGYAVPSSITVEASPSNSVTLRIQGRLFPSSVPGAKLDPGSTYYTATGAPIPIGTDAVARVEEVRVKGSSVEILRPIERGKNVFSRGEDYSRGDLLFSRGKILNSADLALLIFLGRESIKVFKEPMVGILSIGDELVQFGSQPTNGRITNNYFNLISGYVLESGGQVQFLGISSDDPATISNKLTEGAKKCDMMITIGGSSVGEKDYTVRAASLLPDASPIFHGVRMIPIRPAGLVMFGKKPIVILPANAISVAISFFLVAKPVLNLLSGLAYDDRIVRLRATCKSTFLNDKPMTAMYLVSLEKTDEGEYFFESLGWGSNLSNKLSKANGFVQLEPNQTISENEKASVVLLGDSEVSRILRKARN
jgi:molybdopterin molybdotransferase